MLTQAASVAAITGISAVGDKGTFALITKEDVYISYLPLAHVFERAAQGIHLFKGAALGYYQVQWSVSMQPPTPTHAKYTLGRHSQIVG